MRLLFPVSTIVVASGFCCCCGGDFWQDLQDRYGAEGFGGGEEAPAEGEEVPTPEGAAIAPSGPTAVGACGQFKDLGVPALAGLTVTACTDSPESDSIVYMGDADAGDACRQLKGWAQAQGFSVVHEGTIAGSLGITMQKAGTGLVLGCTRAGGQTVASASINTAG